MLIDVPATMTRTRDGIVALGGEVAVFDVGPPATVEQVQSVEREISRAIPQPLRSLFLERSARLRMYWTVEDSRQLPKLVGDSLAGGIDLSLADLPKDLLNWSGWRAAFEDPAGHGWPTDFTVDDYDQLFPVIAGANGDQIVVADASRNPSDAVMYLNHEGGDFNFVVLADTLESFLNTWFQLGCPGPEWWELAPFVDMRAMRLSLRTRRSVAWLRALSDATLRS